MLFSEIIKMAWSSLGANKLRSALTMLGITIGVFSVVSVITAIGELQYSIENGIRTTPSLLIVGTNKSFLTANAHTLAYGRNLNDEDVELARRVIVVGKVIEKRLFPHETPIGKVIRVSGHTYTIIGVLAEKGTAFGQSQDDFVIMPITRFFEDYGETKRTVNIATQAFTQDTYNRTFDRAIGAMRIARGLRPDQPNDFEIYI